MKLEDWHEYLATHFEELRLYRSKRASDRPIFGIEHGLDEAALSDLTSSIQLDIRQKSPSWDHRLAWVVYASEFGYVYSGDEYWQTFEEQTPGWECHGDRYWIRRCFLDFHHNYGGAKPTGTWARHFSIICWPITNAILPRDLQRQLAHLLYELRYVFSQQVLESPRQLGELIAARSWNTSSRFQQLTEEPLFLGQIATALLLHGNDSTPALIAPETLSRISTDVDRERRARAWLRGARQKALHRVQFQHIRGQGAENTVGDIGSTTTAGQVATSGLQPSLVLRPQRLHEWEILVELPDFSNMPVEFRQVTGMLASTRCFVKGSSGRPLARGRLLYGAQRIVLRTWPGNDKQLLKFETSSPELDNLLHTECLLRPGSIWLFKVALDGLAYEVKSSVVRSLQRYIIVMEDGIEPPTNPEFVPVNIDCDGISAIELQLKDTIQNNTVEALTVLGINQATTVKVWPVGLTPIRWDGEGAAEWLSTEKPCIGIRADHHVATFVVDLGFDRISASPTALGDPVFIELPEFDPGVYTAVITGVHDDGSTTECGTLQLRIREPRGWSPGRSTSGAIFVVLDPTNPTLEQLWEGNFEFYVHGPSSRSACLDIAFHKRGEHQPFYHKTGPPFPLPFDSGKRLDYFNKHFKKHQNVRNSFDDAQSCSVSVIANELGTFTFVAEREFTPLRWVARRSRDGFFLRILDDSGSEQTPKVQKYKFNAPDICLSLEYIDYNQAKGTKATSGMYVGLTENYGTGIVIAPEVHTFADLQIEPCISKRQRSTTDVIDLIRIADLWGSARVTGSLFSLYLRRRVLHVLFGEIFRLIAGDRWSQGEKEFQGSQGISLVHSIGQYLKKKPEIEFIEEIQKQIQELALNTPKERAQKLACLSSHVLHLTVSPRTNTKEDKDADACLLWLSEFALRLASTSTNTSVWAGERFRWGISCLLESPSLVRAARFMILAHDQIAEIPKTESNFYWGWTWE